MNRVDQAALMQSLLFVQYKDKPKMTGLIQNIGELLNQDIEDQTLQIYNMCDIDNSTGNVLDAVGSLIGLPRMPVKIPSDVWQLDVTPFTGHVFGDDDYITYELAPDDIYRDAIRAYAINQTAEGDLRSLQASLMQIWGMTVETDLTITMPATLAVDVTVNVAVDPKRTYLVEEYITPNGGALWSKVAGAVYTFTYT